MFKTVCCARTILKKNVPIKTLCKQYIRLDIFQLSCHFTHATFKMHSLVLYQAWNTKHYPTCWFGIKHIRNHNMSKLWRQKEILSYLSAMEIQSVQMCLPFRRVSALAREGFVWSLPSTPLLMNCTRAIGQENWNDTRLFLQRYYRFPLFKKIIAFPPTKTLTETQSRSIAFRNPWQREKPSSTSERSDRVKTPPMTGTLFRAQKRYQ